MEFEDRKKQQQTATYRNMHQADQNNLQQHLAELDTDLSEIIQVDSVVGRTKCHKVAISRAKLHAADIGFAVYASHCRLVCNAPQPYSAIVTATQESGGIRLHDNRNPLRTCVDGTDEGKALTLGMIV